MYQTRFTFLCTEEEKSQLRRLSNFHHRSQSDVVRMLLRKAISDLLSNSQSKNEPNKGVKYEQSSTKS